MSEDAELAEVNGTSVAPPGLAPGERDIAVHQIPLPPDGICDLYLHDPGIVRRVEIGGEAQRVASLTGKQVIQERVILFVEVDQNAPRRKRTFLQLQPGRSFSPASGTRVEWCGCGISFNSNAVAYVWELVQDS